jgi:cysteine-rich repeat protein
MALFRNFRSTAIGLSLFALLSPQMAQADCPKGSGIQFPFLNDTDLQCQRTTFNATVDYWYSFIGARQDCFAKEIKGQVEPGLLKCLTPITDEGPSTTGDADTDRRLRAAEASLISKILNACTNASLTKIGFPGFCDDATPSTPYDAFDHVQCLLKRSQKIGTFILDTEHPPFPTTPFFLAGNEKTCADELARLSSRMTGTEFERRGNCLIRQINGVLERPPLVDCRREVDRQDPQINRPYTDDLVVGSHNHILTALPSACPAVNLKRLGFPHRCSFQDANSVFPLPELTECMWKFHHREVFRYLDLIFPCSTKCGNFVLNVEEECDDADNEWQKGDFCRRDCSRVACGDPNDDGKVNIVDALYVLRAAVGLEHCTLLVCDVTGDLKVRTSDALRLLQYSVGLPVLLNCPDLSVTCGNGYLEAKESCDDGDSEYDKGQYCNSACLLVMCGDTDDSGAVNIIDAQYILNASVGNQPCQLSICDITGNSQINSTDALRALMWAVGLPINFNCPAPPETPIAPPID